MGLSKKNETSKGKPLNCWYSISINLIILATILLYIRMQYTCIARVTLNQLTKFIIGISS